MTNTDVVFLLTCSRCTATKERRGKWGKTMGWGVNRGLPLPQSFAALHETVSGFHGNTLEAPESWGQPVEMPHLLNNRAGLIRRRRVQVGPTMWLTQVTATWNNFSNIGELVKGFIRPRCPPGNGETRLMSGQVGLCPFRPAGIVPILK